MSKPYTFDNLSEQINSDRTWRIREISDLNNAVLRADSISQRVLLRALITICYAHWEGYVKHSARKFIDYVVLKNLPSPLLVHNSFAIISCQGWAHSRQARQLLPRGATLSTTF